MNKILYKMKNLAPKSKNQQQNNNLGAKMGKKQITKLKELLLKSKKKKRTK